MAFIGNSVGLGGKNDYPDVKIIQWLLIKSQFNYGLRLFSKAHSLSESGKLDTITIEAIRDIVIIYPYKSLTKTIKADSLIYDVSTPQKAIIFPDDTYYAFLIRCSIKPVCLVCVDDVYTKIDFYDDPLAKQAVQGTINFQTFKHAVEIKDGVTECNTLTKEGTKAKEHLKDPRVKAFLDMIAWAEAFKANRSVQYNEGSNFVKIDDLAEHPGKTLPGGGTSAAGRYQFMTQDWNDTKKSAGLIDFTPDSQDIAAVYLLMTRSNIIQAVLSDSFAEAVQRACGTWASLPDKYKSKNNDVENNPTSHYPGQPAAALSKLKAVYDSALVSRRSQNKKK